MLSWIISVRQTGKISDNYIKKKISVRVIRLCNSEICCKYVTKYFLRIIDHVIETE